LIQNDIADIDANSKLNPLLPRHIHIAFNHTELDLGSAAQRVDNTGEFDQNAVTGRFDNPAFMLSNFWIDQFTPMRLEAFEGALLACAH
jgi:hypothetical protein